MRKEVKNMFVKALLFHEIFIRQIDFSLKMALLIFQRIWVFFLITSSSYLKKFKAGLRASALLIWKRVEEASTSIHSLFVYNCEQNIGENFRFYIKQYTAEKVQFRQSMQYQQNVFFMSSCLIWGGRLGTRLLFLIS